MKTFENFVNNITRDDVDLINKLDNMCGCEINSELYEFIRNDSELCTKIEDFVIKHVVEYEGFIIDETESLYEQEFIVRLDDYSGGLYNCDEIYMRAILNAIGVLWLPSKL